MKRTHRTFFARADTGPLRTEDWEPVVEQFDLELVSRDGDSSVVSSDDPVALLEFGAKLREHSTRMRCVFHRGREVPMEHRSSPVRETMKLLARCTPAGQFLATGQFHRELQPAAAAVVDASFESIGRHRLRAGGEPFEVFALRFSETPATELAVGSTNLPPERGGFFGRTQELEWLEGAMGAGKSVCLTGPAGIGKTQLAITYARRFMERRPDRDVWHLDFSEADGLDDIFRVVNAELRIPFGTESGTDEMFDTIASVMNGRGRSLVVLDGAQGVRDDVGRSLDRLVPDVPEASWLVTSRQPLDRSGTRTMEIEALDEPAAIELFVVGARRVRLDFLLTESRLEQIVDVVRALEHNPMALELASRQLGSTDLGGLRAQLRDAAGGSDADHRGTVAAYFDPDLNVLTPAQRRALQQCTVFRGPFSRDAARSVIDLPDGGDASDVFDGLVELALIRTTEGGPHLSGLLFRLPESIAEAVEPEDEQLRREALERHLDWYARFAREALALARSDQQIRAMTQISATYANLERAFDTAVERNRADCYAIMHALHELHRLRGPAVHDVELHDRAIEVARSREDEAEAVALRISQWRSKGPLDTASATRDVFGELVDEAREVGAAPDVRARGHRYYSHALLLSGETARAEEVCRRGLEIATRHGAQLERVRLLVERNHQFLITDRVDRVLEEGAVALEEARDLGQPEALAMALRWVGSAHRRNGDYDEAEALYAEALEIFERLGARRRVARTHDHLGELAMVRGHYTDAYRHLSEALRITRQSLGAKTTIIDAIHLDLGELALVQLEFESARRHLRRAYRGLKEYGFDRAKGMALAELAAAEAGLGQEEEALAHFDEAEELLAEHADTVAVDACQLLRQMIALGRVHRGEVGEDELEPVRETLDERAGEIRQSELDTVAIRTVERYMRDLERGEREGTDTANALLVTEASGYFRPPNGDVVDISNRSAPRRILERLVQARINKPGKPVSVFELVEAGWPEEELTPDTAKNRAYVAMQTLRDEGLRGILKNEPGGYYLAPSVPLRRERLEPD